MTVAMRLTLTALTLAAGVSQPALARKTYATVLTENSPHWVKVDRGEPVEIRLRAQGGTGYSWHPTSSASKIHPLSPVRSSRMRPGATEVQRFLFRSKHKGIYIVGFSYGQPWSGGAKRAKSVSFTIKVR